MNIKAKFESHNWGINYQDANLIIYDLQEWFECLPFSEQLHIFAEFEFFVRHAEEQDLEYSNFKSLVMIDDKILELRKKHANWTMNQNGHAVFLQRIDFE